MFYFYFLKQFIVSWRLFRHEWFSLYIWTAWSKSSWEARIPHVVNKFSAFCAAKRFISLFLEPTICLYTDPDQSNHSLLSYIFKIHLNILPLNIVFQVVFCLQVFSPEPCMHFFSPQVSNALPISRSLIWSSKKYLVGTASHECHPCIVLPNPLEVLPLRCNYLPYSQKPLGCVLPLTFWRRNYFFKF